MPYTRKIAKSTQIEAAFLCFMKATEKIVINDMRHPTTLTTNLILNSCVTAGIPS